MGSGPSFGAVSRLLLILFCIVFSSCGQHSPLLKDVNICSVNDPFLNQCVQESVTTLLKNIVSGSPSLKLSSLDPLLVPEYALRPGNNILPSWSFRALNCIQTGWRNAVVQHASVDPVNREFNFRILIPRMDIDCQYLTSGILAGVPLEGYDSDFRISFINLVFDMKFVGDIKLRHGRPYLVVKNFHHATNLERYVWKFTNLYDPETTKQTNDLLNKRHEQVLKLVRPVSNVLFAEANKQFLQKVLNVLPYDEFFRDLPLLVFL